ncbi:MAG: hypothetical protein WDN27_03925 [Candidatus Saccharibacteria bacterium]
MGGEGEPNWELTEKDIERFMSAAHHAGETVLNPFDDNEGPDEDSGGLARLTSNPLLNGGDEGVALDLPDNYDESHYFKLVA